MGVTLQEPLPSQCPSDAKCVALVSLCHRQARTYVCMSARAQWRAVEILLSKDGVSRVGNQGPFGTQTRAAP